MTKSFSLLVRLTLGLSMAGLTASCGDGGDLDQSCLDYCQMAFAGGASEENLTCGANVLAAAGHDDVFDVCEPPNTPADCIQCMATLGVTANVCKATYESCF